MTMNNFDILKRSYLTNDLTDEQVNKIAAISEQMAFGDLQEVLREFDDACDVYILIEGKARVTTDSGDLIARLKPGDIVGEMGLFEMQARTASVISDGDSRFLCLCGKELNSLLDEDSTIGVKILRNVGRSLCAHLRSSNIQLEAVLGTL